MTAETTSGPSRSSRPWWIAIGILVVLLIATVVWKVVSENHAEKRFAEERQNMEQGMLHAIRENTRAMLVLAADPLGLAVRQDAMQENYGEMRQTLDRLVRQPGVQRIVYAGANDSIRVSTDTSLEGKPLSAAIPARYTRPIGISVQIANGAYQAIVPITGLNERIGVLVLTYQGVEMRKATGEGTAPAPADSAAVPSPHA